MSATVANQVPESPRRRTKPGVPDMWTSLAISVIWLVVLVDALFGPDIVSSNAGGFARIPSAIFVAFFAWLATWVVARHGFGRRGTASD